MRDHQSNSSFSSTSRRTSGARGEGLGSSSIGSHVKPSPETIMSRLAYWINQINPTRYAHINRKCAHIVHHWWAEEKSAQWQQWNRETDLLATNQWGRQQDTREKATIGERIIIAPLDAGKLFRGLSAHRAQGIEPGAASQHGWTGRGWGKVLQRKTPKQQLIIVASSWKEKSVANGWGRW